MRWSEHPLGIRRLGYATMTVHDVDATKAIIEKLWQAVPVYDGVDEGRGVRSSFLQLGHLLLELASPLSDDGPVAEHLEQFGEMLYQLTFRVDDLDAVEAYLPTVGVRCDAHVGRGRHRRRRRLPRRQLRVQHRDVPRRPARLTPRNLRHRPRMTRRIDAGSC